MFKFCTDLTSKQVTFNWNILKPFVAHDMAIKSKNASLFYKRKVESSEIFFNLTFSFDKNDLLKTPSSFIIPTLIFVEFAISICHHWQAHMIIFWVFLKFDFPAALFNKRNFYSKNLFGEDTFTCKIFNIVVND